MTHEIVLVSENPEAHRDLTRSIERAGVRVLPRRNLDEARSLLDGAQPSVAGVIFDHCSPTQYNPGPLMELSLRLPNLQQLVFDPLHVPAHAPPHPPPHSDDFKDSEDQSGEARERHSGIHFFAKPLTDPDSYRMIAEVLREILVERRTKEVLSVESVDSVDSTEPLELPQSLQSVDIVDPIPAVPTLLDDTPIAEDRANAAGVSGMKLPLFSEAFLRRVALAEVPVLLHGETGVGKEVMAKRLWAYSGRANKPFLKLNCAALPSELIESELFGYEKGAFTGATIDKIGKFEMAQNGTILLDEIGDMDVRLQAKLLQVLQDGEVQPLGSSRIINVNVRVMAATHRDLRRAIEQGSFREDLYYRLSVINITIPPLRERRNEVLPLAGKLLLRHVPEGFPTPVITEALERAMLAYHWPGNVRELENVMRRFLVYQDAELLARELLENGISAKPETVGAGIKGLPQSGSSIDCLAQAAREAESKLLLEALESARWNRRRAALGLNIDYKAFLYKLQKHGIAESKAKPRAPSSSSGER